MSRDTTFTAEPTRTAALACQSFAGALNAGQLDLATACFALDGCLITPDATAIRGRESIRSVLSQLIARRATIAVEFSSALAAAEVALVHQRWQIRTEGLESVPFVQRTMPTLVLHRIETEWKLAIVAPWGTGERALHTGALSATGATA
jgi:ketosteroid isomerase-like protein